MTHPDTEIAGTSLHRVHMEAQDEPPPKDAWALFDAFLDNLYFWAPFIGVGMGIAAALAFLT